MSHLRIIDPTSDDASIATHDGLSAEDEAAYDRVHALTVDALRESFAKLEKEKLKARHVAFLGIDPGATGCAALIHDGGHDLFDWPGDPALVIPILEGWLVRFDVRLAALEKVGAMLGQGVVSMFSFGQNVGTWHGILAALGIPYVCPRPQDWQRGLVDRKAGNDTKAASLATARRLFPHADLGRKKDHGRADALLLAWWARRQGIGSG